MITAMDLQGGEKITNDDEGMSTQSWSEKKTFNISPGSEIKDVERNYAVKNALVLLSTSERIQLPV